MIKIFSKIILTTFISLISLNAFAANETIEMLNKMGKESMVYSKKVVNINVGDTVRYAQTIAKIED